MAHAIIYQIVLSYGKGVDERLATRAIHVAVQPDGEAFELVSWPARNSLHVIFVISIVTCACTDCSPTNANPGPSMKSDGLIVVPRSLRMFQRERRSNKPASAGGFTQHLQHAAPLVYQTVQRAQVRQLSQTALSGGLGRNRFNSYVANLEREAGDWRRNGRTSSLGADPPCKASQERRTLERTMPSCHLSRTARSSTPP